MVEHTIKASEIILAHLKKLRNIKAEEEKLLIGTPQNKTVHGVVLYLFEDGELYPKSP